MNKAGVPGLHVLAYYYSYSGFRGSSLIWWLAKKLQIPRQGETICTPNGFPLIINYQDWTAKTIYEGTYERALLKLLSTLQINDTSIDVGANLGVTLWHAMMNANPKSRYIGIEPTSNCQIHLQIVCKSLQQQGQILKKSAGEFDGISKIYGISNSNHSGSASLVINSGVGSEETTEVIMLDTLLNQQNFAGRVSLIKIDTEGYEPEVIRGLKETIKRGLIDNLIMEVTPGFADPNHFNFLKNCLGIDYRWFYLDESGLIKKSPRLIEIHPENASEFNTQYNLVIMSNPSLHSYSKQRKRISIKQL